VSAVSASDSALPREFASLEPWVAAGWAGQTAHDRSLLRVDRSPEEVAAFHAAVAPLLDPALAYLDRFPVDRLPPAEERLMRLMLTFAHVALAVEMQGPDEVLQRVATRHMRITRAVADRPPA